MSFVSGIIVKWIFDYYLKAKDEYWRRRISEVEAQISEFYWPIYIRLQKDNVIWRKIIERTNELDKDKRELAHEIEKNSFYLIIVKFLKL